jgi:hypothetical protein
MRTQFYKEQGLMVLGYSRVIPPDFWFSGAKLARGLQEIYIIAANKILNHS